jgi:hypothetical protein
VLALPQLVDVPPKPAHLSLASFACQACADVRCVTVVIAAAILAGGACRSQPKPAAKEVIVWRSIGSWSGQGNAQTGSFANDSGAMRVRWETRKENSPGKGTFRLSLHSAISGRPLLVAVDQGGVGHDTAEIRESPRVSYLVVESANIDWAFTLEEAVGGTVQSSRN